MLGVAVIGARRRRQGTGEYVARSFARAGAEVRAIVGTSEESVSGAVGVLEERYGIHARGYTTTSDLFEHERLDAIAICSPIEAHGAGLEAAAARGIHCLCEKPLLDPVPDMPARVLGFARRFERAGKLFASITQWPETLADFARLHPDIDLARAERFAMRLSPAARGPRMIVDSIPHPVSLLRALAGPGRVTSPGLDWRGDEAVTVRFGWHHARGDIACAVELVRVVEPAPGSVGRPASYAVDGREVHREVRAPGYTMELRAGGRAIAIADPLERLVRRFVVAVSSGVPAADTEGLVNEAEAVATLCGLAS